MGKYGAPGVYVEEVESAIKPIAGVGTSTAGFIGVAGDQVETVPLPGTDLRRELKAEELASDGTPKTGVNPSKTRATHPDEFTPLQDAGKPKLVTSWEDFRSSFGDIQPGNLYLAHAVFGFFHNGGGRCWVVRYNGTGATTTTANVKQALTAFKAIDEIAIVAVPGATTDEVQNAVLDHCENDHLQDRFAVLDGQPAANTGDLTRANVVGKTRSSSYGALYFPWLDVGAVKADGSPEFIPPSGHIAGVYARVDTNRGVHKAPANEPIRGPVGLSRLVSREEQAGVNPLGVNVIRLFDDNVTVWGARTLADPGRQGEWKYVSVRRLFNYLRESIDEGTQWVVFEPNAPELWSRIRRNVSAFLTNVWASGALLGATPEEAFYVHCDEALNPLRVREDGMVVIEIGVAVVRPAEFVVFRISQWAGAGQ